MPSTTCFYVLGQTEFLPAIRDIIAQHFSQMTLVELKSVDEVVASIPCRGQNFRHDNQSQILITDCEKSVNTVNQSGTYLPMVLLENGDTKSTVSQFSSSQKADLSDRTTIIKSISQAIQLSKQFVSLASRTGRLETLADREKQIIAMAAEGVPNKTIAIRLEISIKTVEKNRRKAYSKLAVSSTAEMACLVTFGRFFASMSE